MNFAYYLDSNIRARKLLRENELAYAVLTIHERINCKLNVSFDYPTSIACNGFYNTLRRFSPTAIFSYADLNRAKLPF